VIDALTDSPFSFSFPLLAAAKQRRLGNKKGTIVRWPFNVTFAFPFFFFLLKGLN